MTTTNFSGGNDTLTSTPTTDTGSPKPDECWSYFAFGTQTIVLTVVLVSVIMCRVNGCKRSGRNGKLSLHNKEVGHGTLRGAAKHKKITVKSKSLSGRYLHSDRVSPKGNHQKCRRRRRSHYDRVSLKENPRQSRRRRSSHYDRVNFERDHKTPHISKSKKELSRHVDYEHVHFEGNRKVSSHDTYRRSQLCRHLSLDSELTERKDNGNGTMDVPPNKACSLKRNSFCMSVFIKGEDPETARFNPYEKYLARSGQIERLENGYISNEKERTFFSERGFSSESVISHERPEHNVQNKDKAGIPNLYDVVENPATIAGAFPIYDKASDVRNITKDFTLCETDQENGSDTDDVDNYSLRQNRLYDRLNGKTRPIYRDGDNYDHIILKAEGSLYCKARNTTQKSINRSQIIQKSKSANGFKEMEGDISFVHRSSCPL